VLADAGRNQRLLVKPRRPFVVGLLLLYSVLMLLASAANATADQAFQRWILLVAPVFAALVAIYCRPELGRWLILSTVAAGAAHAFLALTMPRIPLPNGLFRAAGLTHPVSVAFDGAMISLSALALASQRAIPRAAGLAAAAFGVAAIIAARGRAGATGLAIGVVVLVLMRVVAKGGIRSRWAGIGALAVAGLPIITPILAPRALSWYARGDISDLGTLTGRTTLWRLVLRAIEERPVTGWGVGSLRSGELAIRITEEAFGGHAHNALLEATLSGGLLAGALWLLLIRLLVGSLWSLSGTDRALGVALCSLLAVNSITDGGPAGYGLTWHLLLALLVLGLGRRVSVSGDADVPVTLSRHQVAIT
jgi:O-antigen ligase